MLAEVRRCILQDHFVASSEHIRAAEGEVAVLQWSGCSGWASLGHRSAALWEIAWYALCFLNWGSGEWQFILRPVQGIRIGRTSSSLTSGKADPKNPLKIKRKKIYIFIRLVHGQRWPSASSLESFSNWGTQDILGSGDNCKAVGLTHNDLVVDLLGEGVFPLFILCCGGQIMVVCTTSLWYATEIVSDAF